MAITIPTATLLFDTRRELKGSGKYPVKLTVYFLGLKRRYKLPYVLTKEEWLKVNSAKLRDEELKDIRMKLDFYIGEKFADALKKIEEPFTFEKFEDAYFEKNTLIKQDTNVYTAYQNYIDHLNNDDKVGNAQIHDSAMKSFIKLKKNLTFNEVTPDFLSLYEKQMLDKGKSVAYISMNLRTLRSIFNMAISQGIVKQDSYPFSTKRNDKNYKVKKGNNTKKALTTDELRILINHKANTPAQQKALKFWLLSFYANGINMKDICQLQYKNIVGNHIVFQRAKTENSTTSSQPIRLEIIPEIQAIISQYGNRCISPDSFIFNVLQHGISAKKEFDAIKSFTRNINKHMKAISIDLKFEVPLSTYYARHSFSTFLKREGVSIEVISEALGHSSVNTTRNYLDSFNDDTISKTGNLLSSI